MPFEIKAIGKTYRKLIGPSKKMLKTELSTVTAELNATKTTLEATEKKLGTAEQKIAEAEAQNAKIFHSIANGVTRWNALTTNIKAISENSQPINEAIDRIATNTQTPEDCTVLKQYSKSLKNYWLQLSKEPSFYDRQREFCKAELKGFDPKMLNSGYAKDLLEQKHLIARSQLPYYNGEKIKTIDEAFKNANKTLELLVPRKQTVNLTNEFTHNYYDKLYKQTYLNREKVTEAHLQMIK